VLFVAAFVAGTINSVAGGGTLLSYPALVWAGLDPIVANATSTVSLWPGTFASLVAYRKDLEGTRRWVLLLAVPSIVGGLTGAVLLLLTPSKVFAAVVPWLILGATGLRAARTPIGRGLKRLAIHETSLAWSIGAIAFQFVVGLYGGYFGAGIGIMMLAAFGLLGLTDIHQMNGLKCLAAIAINGVAASYFVIRGAVHWPDVLLMGVGAIAGGYFGAVAARKLGQRFVNTAVVVIGLAMGVYLLLR